MPNLGVSELVLLVPLALLLAVLIYGILMTIDSIRRPASQYRRGKRPMWIVILILTNPLLTWFAGVLVWPVSLFIFLIAAVVYHSQNRWHHRIQTAAPGGAV